MVLRHEQQHTETMLQTLLLGAPRGLRASAAPRCAPRARRPRGSSSSPSPAGAFELGRAGGASPTTTSARATASRRAVRDRAHAGHQRDLAALRRGRRLRAARVVVRGGLGLEGGVRHHSPLHWARRPDGAWSSTRCTAAPLDPDRPAAHVSWFEAAAVARAHGARLPTEAEWETAATWDQEPTDGDRDWSGSGRRREFARLPRLRRAPLPRVLRGLLRQRPPRAARRLVGDAAARRHPDVPQLGPATAPPDLLRRAAGPRQEQT